MAKLFWGVIDSAVNGSRIAHVGHSGREDFIIFFIKCRGVKIDYEGHAQANSDDKD